MSFSSVNARRSARRRYRTPYPEASGSFSQAERQQLRWRYSGLLLPTPSAFSGFYRVTYTELAPAPAAVAVASATALTDFDDFSVRLRRGDGDLRQGKWTVTDAVSGTAVDLSTWQKFYFTAKRSLSDADTDAVIRLTSMDGLDITAAAAGVIYLVVPRSATVDLPARRARLYADLQGKDAAGQIVTLAAGLVTVLPDVSVGVA